MTRHQSKMLPAKKRPHRIWYYDLDFSQGASTSLRSLIAQRLLVALDAEGDEEQEEQ